MEQYKPGLSGRAFNIMDLLFEVEEAFLVVILILCHGVTLGPFLVEEEHQI